MSRTLVLGIGNPLMSDEGFGIEAVARLRDRFVFPSDVELVDGGTLGLALLPTLEDADRIVILDAVDLGEAPAGTLARLGWDDVPRTLLLKVSPHQESVAESLALLELRRGRPEALEVVGAQPGSLDWGTGLTPAVESALETALDAVLAILKAWGHDVKPRARASSADSAPTVS